MVLLRDQTGEKPLIQLPRSSLRIRLTAAATVCSEKGHMSNYAAIIKQNLARLYADRLADMEQNLPCDRRGDQYLFQAFGAACRITPGGIFLDNRTEVGPRGIVISLYALHHAPHAAILEPFTAFRELPGSQPYAGAFAQHTEAILAPHVACIESGRRSILAAISGKDLTGVIDGDVCFHLRPLPKITLRYIFYRSDEDFPAAATCLFSCNALSFIPLDALADLAEYTSRRIVELAGQPPAVSN